MINTSVFVFSIFNIFLNMLEEKKVLKRQY